MRVFLIIFYLAAVVGCKASVKKTQLASGVQDSDTDSTGAIKTENENENGMDRLPPVITDPQKINRLATGLAQRGVPKDLIEDVIRELTSERVSRKKFTSKIVDINLPDPSGSPVPFFSQTPGVLTHTPTPIPITVLDYPPPILSPIRHNTSPFTSLSKVTRSSLAAYNITASVFNALCA